MYYACFAVVVLELCLDKATCMSLWGEKEMVQRESFDEEGKGKEKSSLWRAVNGFPSGSKRHLVNLLKPGSELSQAQSLQVNFLRTGNACCPTGYGSDLDSYTRYVFFS